MNSPRRVCVGGILSTDMYVQLTDRCPIPNTFRTPQNNPQRDRDTSFGPGRRFRYIPRWFRLLLVRDRAGGEALLLVRLVVRRISRLLCMLLCMKIIIAILLPSEMCSNPFVYVLLLLCTVDCGEQPIVLII